jgi:DNA (cytosine-5)-methyltransferase 1
LITQIIKMRHGSLFSGIGGFDLAAEWMGWENVFHCERDAYCRKILKHYWPDAISYEDITKTDFSIHRGRIDILTGGFPCQPFSVAGKRKGKEDARYLWPEMLRAIREIQPCFIVGENVGGLVNWSRGMVFEQVQADLETEGYESAAFILPACAVNAPHRRDRIWFIAHAKDFQRHSEREEIQQRRTRGEAWSGVNGNGLQGIIANTEQRRCKECRRETVSEISYNSFQEEWLQVEPLLCRGNDGLSNWMDRIKALGNAIVPQVAYEIFKAIEKTEKP